MAGMQSIEDLLEVWTKENFESFDNDKDEALEFLSSELQSFPKYVNVVVNEQIMMPIYKAKYEGQDYRDAVMNIDKSRRIQHEQVICSVNILNRTCDRHGIARFADIDTTDRHAVANFAGIFVNDLYNKGIGNEPSTQQCYAIDNAVKQGVEERKDYHADKVKETVSNIAYQKMINMKNQMDENTDSKRNGGLNTPGE